MRKQVLVVGHADADGHVIAEQTRRNLALVPTFAVDVVVDPVRTQGHKSWNRIAEIDEISRADLVVFVDLMFGPVTYAAESDALTAYLRRFPTKKFLLIDHHPLPERRLAAAANLRSIYRPDVFDCTLGPRSGLMVLAALCENQRGTVAPILATHHEILARGLRRAAALGGPLAGDALMNLLAMDRWDAIYALGAEDAAEHRLVRGRRSAKLPQSSALQSAYALAVGTTRKPSLNVGVETLGGRDSGSASMPFDISGERYVREDEHTALRNAPVETRDLEQVSTLMEVAALSLTEAPGTTFTWEQLVAEVRDLAGAAVEVAEREMKIVYDKAPFLERAGGALRLR